MSAGRLIPHTQCIMTCWSAIKNSLCFSAVWQPQTRQAAVTKLRSFSAGAVAQVDCVVIGAGVVGLACARSLALAGQEVVVLEAADAIGTGTSSRNSEVIHAGMYYPVGSLKAALCVEGRHMLYDYCSARGIPHRRIGKLVVATSHGQLEQLKGLQRRGSAAGVKDLHLIGRKEAAGMEPVLHCEGALVSPSTGILDSHSLMEALLADAEGGGALLSLGSKVLGGGSPGPGSSGAITLEVAESQTGETSLVSARYVVNCAGLYAQQVASTLRSVPATTIPALHLSKGCYFALSGPCPFSRLIYPLPDNGGLGVHLTIDMGGQAKFGPDTNWVDAVEYAVNPQRAQVFYPAIRAYWPSLPDGALHADYAGIRAKLSGRGEPAADFQLQGERTHGVRGLVNLYGIESPGLTSCLAIAERIRQMLLG